MTAFQDAGGTLSTTTGEVVSTTGLTGSASGTTQPNAGGPLGGTSTTGDVSMPGTTGADGTGTTGGVDLPDAGATGGAGLDGGGDGTDSGDAGDTPPAEGCEVTPITDEMRDQYSNMNDPYYQKFASANGVVVATGPDVDDEAVVQYCRLLREMFSNEEVLQAVLADDMWFTMIDEDEQLSSLPQIGRVYGSSLDRRARGLGSLTPTICAEDSIMCLPGDPWVGDCICAHETGHTLYSSGIARVPELSRRLRSITDSVRSSGRLANAYVWMDGNESGMMAWGVQAWYDCAIDGRNGGYHSDINTRAELQQELPEFHEFLSELLPADNLYQDCYANP